MNFSEIPVKYHERVRPVIRPYVYAVFSKKDPNCLEPIGSCVFIRYREKYFLITATHLWIYVSTSLEGTIFVYDVVGTSTVGESRNFIKIPGKPKLSERAGNKDDNEDIAVFELSDTWFEGQRFSAVPESMQANHRDRNNLHQVLHGFPVAQNRNFRLSQRRHETRSTIFFEERVDGFDFGGVDPRIKYSEENNIAMRYEVGLKPKNPGNCKVSNKVSSEPVGLSGGAIWTSPSLFLDPSEFCLTGMVITKEIVRRKLFVIAVRLHVIHALIDRKFFN